jgi:hypothetical protein
VLGQGASLAGRSSEGEGGAGVIAVADLDARFNVGDSFRNLFGKRFFRAYTGANPTIL